MAVDLRRWNLSSDSRWLASVRNIACKRVAVLTPSTLGMLDGSGNLCNIPLHMLGSDASSVQL